MDRLREECYQYRRSNCILWKKRQPISRGVAIILSKTAAQALVEYHPTNERIIRVRLKTKPVETSTIQVHAPTNDAENEIKQEYYEALKDELQKVPKQDLTILMGYISMQMLEVKMQAMKELWKGMAVEV